MSFWNDITTLGSGTVDYRLMIEGWPHEWVTNVRITHGTNKNGRTVYPGLQYKGLRIQERVILENAWPDVSGMTVTLSPTDDNEDTLNGFTRDSQDVGELAGDIDDDDTTWSTKPPNLAAGVYHLASEAVACDGSNNITRQYWDTLPQKHATEIQSKKKPVPIYSWPPTMEGRRAYLYAYGTSDDPAGDGNVIWRGIVARPPRMAGDGVSWTIELQPITTAFDQNVGSNDEKEYRVRGIYHSSDAPFAMWFKAGAQNYPENNLLRVTGFYETEAEWFSAINDAINALILSLSLPDQLVLFLTKNSSFGLHFDGWIADDARFRIVVKDVIDGDTQIGSPMFDTSGDGKQNGGELVDGTFTVLCGDSTSNFVVWGSNVALPYGYPLPEGRTFVGTAQLSTTGEPGGSYVNPDRLVADYIDPSDTTWPNNRVYLDSVDGLAVGDRLIVKDSADFDNSPLWVDIAAIDTDERWIEVDMAHSGSFYLTSDMPMVKVALYPINNDVAGFVQDVVNKSINANIAADPWITTADVDATQWNDAYAAPAYWRHRAYRFLKPTKVKDIVQPELQVAGWMARLDAAGRLALAQMPFVSPSRTAAHTITDDDILYPAQGSYGAWPTWEAQRDGLVNIILLKLGYSPYVDDFDPRFDFLLRNTASISEHKSGEKAKKEIAPRSIPTFGGTVKKRLSDLPAASELVDMVAPYLQTLSQDYALVTIAVPFTKFGVLCGDIVSITSKYLPNGQGSRGVTGKKAICIAREWELDPASNRMGKLTFWFSRDSGKTAGYAPTGRITGASNPSGNVWLLSFGTSNAYNIAWSEDGDGDVVKHFGVGDSVEVLKVDVTTENRIEGQITDIPSATQIEVTFAGTWTPSGQYNMRFVRSGTVPAGDRQNQYCWVADSTANGARRFL